MFNLFQTSQSLIFLLIFTLDSARPMAEMYKIHKLHVKNSSQGNLKKFS